MKTSFLLLFENWMSVLGTLTYRAEFFFALAKIINPLAKPQIQAAAKRAIPRSAQRRDSQRSRKVAIGSALASCNRDQLARNQAIKRMPKTSDMRMPEIVSRTCG